MKNSKGFTLIELVVVISIVGILAAVALPRFVSMQTDARIAKLNAVRGAVGASAALVHAVFLTRNGVADIVACPGGGGIATNTTNICTEAGVVALVFGYPQALLTTGAGTPGIISSGGLTSVFNPTPAQLATEGYGQAGGGAGGGAVLTITVLGNVPATCSFTYTAPVAAGASAVVSAATTTGC